MRRVDVALAVGAEGVHIGQDDIGMLWGFHECVFSQKTYAPVFLKFDYSWGIAEWRIYESL